MEDQFINVAEPGSRVTNLNATRTELIPTPRLPRSGSSIRLCGLLAALGSTSAFGVAAPLGSQETELVETAAMRVFAASSLGTGLPAALDPWARETGTALEYVFDASSRLAPQVAAGAPADILITADRAWMQWARERGAIQGDVVLVARNRLVLIEEAGQAPSSPADPLEPASWPSGRILLAGENVPAGRYATETLRAAGHWEALEERVLRGGSARGVLESVASGAVPLGIVYRSDVVADERTRVVLEFPDSLHEAIGYFAAVAVTSRQPALAAELVTAMGGAGVREGLTAYGFGPATDEDGLAGGTGLTAEPVLPDPGRAITLSLVVAFAATLAALPFAILLGWILARLEFPGRSVVAMVVLTPLVLPPVVTGFLLLSFLGGGSPLGRFLAGLGLDIPFTLLGAVLAAAIVGIPLYVAAIRGAFESVDPHLEEVAWTLGVRPRRTFLRVTLPLAAPGIAAGAILAFARALGEFGATVVLAGNLEGETRTIALAVYTLLEAPGGRSAIWVLVGASLLLSGGALLGYEVLNRRQRNRLEVRR
jgi:molybdate transport system permease protein